MQKHTVIDNETEQHYEMNLGDAMAVVEYEKEPGRMIITHTFVPAQHEGQGIGSELARFVLEDARSKGMQVVPLCNFIAQYIFRHPEWEEIVYREEVKEQ